MIVQLFFFNKSTVKQRQHQKRERHFLNIMRTQRYHAVHVVKKLF